MLRLFTIFLIPFLFLACSKKSVFKDQVLVELLENVAYDKKEASFLASDLKSFSKELKQRYSLTPYANFNNFLVNIGVKERGLCWELAYDMLRFLKSKNYSIDYYIGGANIGSYWTEHNVLVLTCKGCKFEEGVVVDTWRNGGELYVSKIKKDEKFSWTQRGAKR